MRIKKVSQAVGVVGNVANQYTEDSNAVYNAPYVNNISSKMEQLWSGNVKTGSVTLSKSLENYDFLALVIQGDSYSKSTFIIPVQDIFYYSSGDTNEYRWSGTVQQTSSVYANLSLYFTNSTTITGLSSTAGAWAGCFLKKVYGIKL